MKITIYYEDKNHPTTLEVSDEECFVMVETDYHQRLETAVDKASVQRRTMQEIMDEDFNKPNFNSHQRETRRHVSLEACDIGGNVFAGAEDVETTLYEEDYATLYQAIEALKPRQRDLLRKVFWDDVRQIEIARAEGVSELAMQMFRSLLEKGIITRENYLEAERLMREKYHPKLGTLFFDMTLT